MTLDESNDGLDKLDSNGITAYIDPGLVEQLKTHGNIFIDYVTNPDGQSGYAIRVGGDNCKGCSCS